MKNKNRMTFLLWNLFFRLRLPKDLYDFDNPFLVLILCGMLIGLLITLKQLLGIELNPKSKISNFYLQNIKEGPKAVYNYIIHNPYFNISFIIEIPIYKLVQLFAGKSKAIIYIITNTLPRIFTVSIFIIDIFVFHHVKFFYYSLILLGIPLIINAYRYIIETVSDMNNIFLLSHLQEVLPKESGYTTYKLADETPSIEGAINLEGRQNDHALLSWFVSHYDTYSNIKNFILRIKDVENLIKPYENLYVYGFYVLGWGFLIYLNMANILSNSLSLFYLIMPTFISPF
jgi:hypothetical protein